MDLLLQLALVINLSFFILDAHKTFVLAAGSSANMSWLLIDVVLWYFSSSLIRFLPFCNLANQYPFHFGTIFLRFWNKNVQTTPNIIWSEKREKNSYQKYIHFYKSAYILKYLPISILCGVICIFSLKTWIANALTFIHIFLEFLQQLIFRENATFCFNQKNFFRTHTRKPLHYIIIHMREHFK